jgi:hypothetical protein
MGYGNYDLLGGLYYLGANEKNGNLRERKKGKVKQQNNQNQYSYPRYSRSESISVRSHRPRRPVYMSYKIGGL